ncbi:MAG TPA: hypothetical protein VFF52_11005 [Isosphaeraceae bacterium]|nr:hypothetical protein [Isosphaeraceae bacterium]
MQALKLLVTTAVVAGALASSATAQSRGQTPTAKKKAPPPPSVARRKASPPGRTVRKPPPLPPPAAIGRSFARSGSTLSARSLDAMFLGDRMGRMDLSGRPVPFYPSARSLNRGQQSASRAPQAGRASR